jgi:predicted nucleic acid-binding protein
MIGAVVVDANVVIKRVVPEVLSDQAHALFATWEHTETILLAPAFFLAEVDSILRQKVVVKKELTEEQAQDCWNQLQTLPVVLVELSRLRRRTWEIAVTLRQGHVYDAVYLALAEEQSCDFWTADERLVNAAKDRFPFIKFLRDA